MGVIPIITYNKNEELSETIALKIQEKLKNLLSNKNYIHQFSFEKNVKRPGKSEK
jgi:hypothetical protein